MEQLINYHLDASKLLDATYLYPAGESDTLLSVFKDLKQEVSQWV